MGDGLVFASALLGVEVDEEGVWAEVADVDVGLGRGGGNPLNGMERNAGYVWKKRVGNVVPKKAPT